MDISKDKTFKNRFCAWKSDPISFSFNHRLVVQTSSYDEVDKLCVDPTIHLFDVLDYVENENIIEELFEGTSIVNWSIEGKFFPILKIEDNDKKILFFKKPFRLVL